MTRVLKRSLAGALLITYLLLCILLGGASGVSAGIIPNALLQILGLGLILYVLWTRESTPFPVQAKPLVLVFVLFLTVCLISLVPLPPSLWRNFPGRESIAASLEMVGMPDVWLPLSLVPDGTISSLLWLIPPAAMFLLVLHASWSKRKALVPAILVLAILSAGLGAAQMLGGADSSLRFYDVTNPGAAVGFFANANHLATLLLCALPFAGYVAARRAQRASKAKTTSAVAVAIAIGIFVGAGIALTGSQAGYGLFLLSAAATVLIYRRAAFGTVTKGWIAGVAILALLLVGLGLADPLRQQEVSSSFEERGSRREMAATTVEAIKDTFPVGTGLGSFVGYYRTYEPITVGPGYVNHAHNDYVEFVLELGIVGLLLIAAFLWWWGRLSLALWRSSAEGANLGRAASVAILVVVLHSVVDYPLRTSAVAAFVAMCCALMIPPPTERRRNQAPEGRSGLKHLEAD